MAEGASTPLGFFFALFSVFLDYTTDKNKYKDLREFHSPNPLSLFLPKVKGAVLRSAVGRRI